MNPEPEMKMPSGQRKPISNTDVLAAHKNPNGSGGIVPPLDRSSTFIFKTAEDGEYSFACAYGLANVKKRIEDEWEEKKATDKDLQAPQYFDIYARLSGPTIQKCEKSLLACEPKAKWAMVFPSGMAAISSIIFATCHAKLNPKLDPKSKDTKGDILRDVFIHSKPLYGGTHAMAHIIVKRPSLKAVEIDFTNLEELRTALQKYGDRVGLVLIETPANPTLDMLDISGIANVIDNEYTGVIDDKHKGDHRPVFAVDNTFAGIYQQPIVEGADLSFYSCTKFMGGHSDMIAGAIMGTNRCKVILQGFDGSVNLVPVSGALGFIRTIYGFTTSPDVAHTLMMHLHTYKMRMKEATENAIKVADWLKDHPKVTICFPTLLSGKQKEIYDRQMTGPSAMIAIQLRDNTKTAAYKFINALKTVVRAVSLGSTASLIDHPATWTHSDIMVEDLEKMGITPGCLRLSIGLEEADDIIADIKQALKKV